MKRIALMLLAVATVFGLETGPGRSRISGFEAYSTFTHVTACMLAWSPSRPSAPEASAVSLPPLPL